MSDLDGFINVNKEKGITSFVVIRKLRKILKMKKIGHTGTLDPIAEGVLVICVGKSTKLASEIESSSKVYTATMEFGYSTPSYDSETDPDKINNDYFIEEEELETVLQSFSGATKQEPPMYSAIKKDGKKLYELARKNIVIERKLRDVVIEYIKLKSFTQKQAIFETKVSKGTYIRSLINDIGLKLGSYATMTGLVRNRVGDFALEKSYNLDEIEEMVSRDEFSFIITPEDSFNKYTDYFLKGEREKHLFVNGNTVIAENIDGIYKIYFDDEFCGLGKIENERLKGYKYFGEGVLN